MNKDVLHKPDAKPEKEEVYATWMSPSRLFKRRDKEYFTNIAAIVFLLTVILIFAREFVLIAAVLSIVFLIYVLSTVPPEEVKHRITNFGIESSGEFYRWEELDAFWLDSQWGQHLLILKTILGVRMTVLLGAEDPEKIRKIVGQHLPFRETPEKNWVDNAASWLSEKIPLEKPSA